MPKDYNETPAYTRNVGFDMRISYDSSNRTQYVGEAYPGALTSEEKWRIFKLTYDGTSGRVVARSYARKNTETVANDDYKKEWDERTNYNYTN